MIEQSTQAEQRAHVSEQETGESRIARSLAQVRFGALGLLLVALALAAAAQHIFLMRQAFSIEGAASALLSIVMFWLAHASANEAAVQPDSLRGRLLLRLKGNAMAITMLAAATGLTCFNLFLLASDPPLTNYNVTFLPWLGAMGLYMLALNPDAGAAGQAEQPRQPRRWLSGWRSILLLLAITALAAGLRVIMLSSLPYTVGGDEGSQGLDAVKVLRGEINNPFGLGWLSVPTMAGYINAITVKLFGNTVLGLRLIWAVIGVLTIPLAFLLVRRLWGSLAGGLTSALLATYHYHIHYSRLGAAQIADPFFNTLALLLLYRAYDRRSRIDWALCGLIIGIAQYSYAGARFTVVLVFGVCFYLFLRGPRQFWREQRVNVLVMLGAALIAAAPMLQVALRFPDDYNARLNDIGILQNGWLEREQLARNESTLSVLLDQVKRAVLSYNAYPDNVVWYGLDTGKPLFDFAWGALFLLGMGYGLLRLHDRRIAPMVIWWWGAILLGGALTDMPPSSQRLTGTIVPAVFFVALALILLGRTLVAALGQPRLKRLAIPAMLVTVLGLSYSSLSWYFRDYTPMGIYGSQNGLVATQLAYYGRDRLDTNSRVYFFGAPRMVYQGFATLPYLAPEVEAFDFIDPLIEPLQPGAIGTDKDAVFVFLPERLWELEAVRQTYPGGSQEEQLSPFDQSPLFTIYTVKREQL